MSLTDAIILAAGRGTRIWPYGDTQPKAALPIGNTPLIRRQIEVLRGLGIKRIAVGANHFESTLRHLLAGLEGVEVVSVGPTHGTKRQQCQLNRELGEAYGWFMAPSYLRRDERAISSIACRRGRVDNLVRLICAVRGYVDGIAERNQVGDHSVATRR